MPQAIPRSRTRDRAEMSRRVQIIINAKVEQERKIKRNREFMAIVLTRHAFFTWYANVSR
jgi:hypothetical protein